MTPFPTKNQTVRVYVWEYRGERCGISENHATDKENYKTIGSHSILFCMFILNPKP